MKVLIVEFYTWHDECIYTTCKLLKQSGAEVHLALNQDIRNRTEATLGTVADSITYYPFRKGIKAFVFLWQLRRYAVNNGFSHIYFNTASGSETFKLFLLPLPKRLKLVGTLHNVKKLEYSFGQKFITRRINGYTLLSDLLTPYYNNMCEKPSAAIYPIIYPKIDVAHVIKSDGEIWIGIPGAVSFMRRDYTSLITAVAGNVGYGKNIKFVILGNIHRDDGESLLADIRQSSLESNFIIFESYVPDDVFYGYVCQCDYLMPLVHPHKKEYSKYLDEKISGTYNLAFAYKIPMLCPTEMMEYDDFKDTSLFYLVDGIVDFVNTLTPPQLSQFFNHPKWSADAQGYRLLDFLSRV